jgi:cysteine synthase
MKRIREIVIRVPDRSARYVALKKGTFKTVGHGRTLAAALKNAKDSGHPDAAAMWIPQPGRRYIF